jgi:pilus assembly protein Flp/PilA
MGPAYPVKPAARLNRSFSVFPDAPAIPFEIDFAASVGVGQSPAASTGVLREFLMRQLWLGFLRDQSGATAIEYCLIACGIAFAIITAVLGIGPTLNTKFTAVNTSLK